MEISIHLGGVLLIKPRILEDNRGLFTRTFCKEEFSEFGFQKEFVQFNHSFNRERGTIRGMHFQRTPHTESKLIRCIQGSVFDVAVDLRKGSPTFLQYFAVELSAKNMYSVLIPDGFAHGFQALEDNSTLIYHHTAYYTPNADAGILYNDPAINIKWPLPPVNLSIKDREYSQINHIFEGIVL
jgi:dTDP-4-dehydrorhamnose 3,5-epimerase